MLTMTRKKGDIITITTPQAAVVNIHIGKKPPTRCGDANMSIDAEKSVSIKWTSPKEVSMFQGTTTGEER